MPPDTLTTAPRRNVLAVVAWMSGTLLSFSAIAVSIRELAGVLGVFEILALRNAAGVAILLALALARPSLRHDFVPRRIGLHFTRNFVHFLAQFAWALGITLLPLATVFAIEFTTPAWVALFAALILREQLTRPRVLAIVFGLVGIFVILRPGTEALDPAALIVLACAMMFALVTVMTKRLTATESTFAILFWMNVMQLPMNYLGSDPLFFLKIPELPLLPLLGICIGGLSAHYCLTNAYRRGDAVVVIPLDFMRLPLIALVGFWLYAEPLDPYVFVGALIIVAGILQSLRAETLRARPRSNR